MRTSIRWTMIVAAAALASPALAQQRTTAPADAIITDEGWFAKPAPQGPRAARPTAAHRPVVIPIREPITTKTLAALRRKTVQARNKERADLIVFDMDTWGGMLEPAMDIARLIKVDLADTYTVCFVRTRAVSAGALIALACDEIIATPRDVKIGDAAPIVMGGGELDAVNREKMESVMRVEFAESARRNGYPPALAQSMVSIDLEVWLIRNRQTGELRYVLASEYQHRRPAGKEDAPTTQPLSALDGWDILRVVVPAGQLLTMDAHQAVDYGFVSKIVSAPADAPYRELLATFGATGPAVVLADRPGEKVIGFLSHPAVMSILMFIIVLGIYIELSTPGFGVPGILALTALALVFVSQYMTGMALWWELAIFIIGALLLAIEIFVMPGFGVAGVLGVIMMIGGLVMMVMNNPPGRIPVPRTDLDWTLFRQGILALSVGLIGAVAAGAVIGRFLPKFPIARRLVLKASPAAEELVHVVDEGVSVGQVGVTQTTCRPVGRVLFGDRLVDAVCEEGVLPAGVQVRVVRREGNTIVVQQA